MKHFQRLLTLIIALAAAGGLGYRFQPRFDLVKYIIFAAAVLIVSGILYQIDKYIMYKNIRK